MFFDCFLSDTPAFKRLQPWPEAVGIASPGQRPCAGYLSWPKPVRTSSWRPGQRRCAGQDPACWSLLIMSPLLCFVFVYEIFRLRVAICTCLRCALRCSASCRLTSSKLFHKNLTSSNDGDGMIISGGRLADSNHHFALGCSRPRSAR